jgi:glycerophosphoryl diester phosphodiesterase
MISFSLPLIAQAKRMMRDVPAYWVYGFSLRERARWGNPTMHGLIRKAESAGLDGLDLAGEGPITKEFVDKLRAKGMDLYVWTVNDPRRARQLLAMGVTGITTDRPGFMRRQLGL